MEKNTLKMDTAALRLFTITISIFLLLSCDKSENGESSDNSTGKGGSMARFTISKNYLYTVDQMNLNIFDLSGADNPVFVKNLQAGYNIETIFAGNNTLYLGTQWGMLIYDITNPLNPVNLSFFQHIYSCDPVVANDSLAYLTMRTESFCGRNTNELQVIDIRNKNNPVFISRIAMTKPLGLGIDGTNLFVCDKGLKVFSLTDPFHPKLTKTFDISAIDVIPDNNLLIVLATDGLYQYKYQNDTVSYLSHLQ